MIVPVSGSSPAGGPVVPGPPFEIGAPHFTFGPRLLHTSNTVFLKCGPLPLNPGNGPALCLEVGKVRGSDYNPAKVTTKKFYELLFCPFLLVAACEAIALKSTQGVFKFFTRIQKSIAFNFETLWARDWAYFYAIFYIFVV